MLWFLAFAAALYVAWRSGEHHAARAKRIVERNRPERQRKWSQQELEIRQLKLKVKELEGLLKVTI